MTNRDRLLAHCSSIGIALHRRRAALLTRCVASFILLCFCVSGPTCLADLATWVNPELAELRTKQDALRSELNAFGNMSLGITSEEVGSQFHMVESPPSVAPWTQLDLGSVKTFDSVTIVPAVTTSDSDASMYGFPTEFRVDASKEPSFGRSTPLFLSSETNFDPSDGLPVVIHTRGAKARYIRITVTKLARIAQRWTYALGEIIVLQGNQNIARDAAATMQRAPRIPPKWHPKFLIDGRTAMGPPIILDLPELDGTYTPVGAKAADKWMQVDLGKSVPINEVRLHPIHARQGAHFPGYAFPKRFRIDAATDPAFKNAFTLFDTDKEIYPNPGNNPVSFSADGTPARFVRFTCIETWGATGQDRLGLSEIQVYSDGHNVALNQPATIPGAPEARPPKILTDGYTSYGKLIELPDWVQRWGRYRTVRLSLKKLDSQIAAQVLVSRKRNQWLMGLLIGASLICLAAWVAWRRSLRLNEQTQFRMRLAQDLHDEIGSNLAAMARLGEVAVLETDAQQARRDWQSVRQMALECTDSMRETLWILGGKAEQGGNLPQRLKRTANRMLPNVDIQWQQNENDDDDDWEGDKLINRELFLMFKEIIANIAKHADATKVEIQFTREKHSLSLVVTDNGVGFDHDQPSSGMGLRNVRYRSTKQGGTCNIDAKPTIGTTVRVHLPIRDKR